MLTPTSPDLPVQMVNCYDVWISRMRERKRVPLTTNEIAHRTTTSADGRASRWVGETEGWEKQSIRTETAEFTRRMHMCTFTHANIPTYMPSASSTAHVYYIGLIVHSAASSTSKRYYCCLTCRPTAALQDANRQAPFLHRFESEDKGPRSASR